MPLQGNIVSETFNAKHFPREKIATCINTAIGLIQMSNIWYVLMVVLVHHMLMSITNVTTIFKFDFK